MNKLSKNRYTQKRAINIQESSLRKEPTPEPLSSHRRNVFQIYYKKQAQAQKKKLAQPVVSDISSEMSKASNQSEKEKNKNKLNYYTEKGRKLSIQLMGMKKSISSMRRSSLRAAPKELHQMNFIKLIQNNPNMQHTNMILRKQKTFKTMKSTTRILALPTSKEEKNSNRSVDISNSECSVERSQSIASVRKQSYDLGSPTKIVKFDADSKL